jgi:hypothetical protein
VFPYSSAEYSTSLPPVEVRNRLAGIVAQSGDVFPASSTKEFVGEVEDRTFRIYRKISYRNSFLPILRGRIEPQASGTRIRIRYDLHPFVCGFLIFFIAVSLVNGGLVGLGFVLFSVVLTLAGFIPERWKAEPRIRELLEIARSMSAGAAD